MLLITSIQIFALIFLCKEGYHRARPPTYPVPKIFLLSAMLVVLSPTPAVPFSVMENKTSHRVGYITLCVLLLKCSCVAFLKDVECSVYSHSLYFSFPLFLMHQFLLCNVELLLILYVYQCGCRQKMFKAEFHPKGEFPFFLFLPSLP